MGNKIIATFTWYVTVLKKVPGTENISNAFADGNVFTSKDYNVFIMTNAPELRGRTLSVHVLRVIITIAI